jgi:hypothetical protein
MVNWKGYGRKQSLHILKYKGESVNRSQINIKCKTCDIPTWEKHLFLDISSTNTATLFPSLHQCIKTSSTKSFGCCLIQFCTFISTSSSSAKCLPPSCEQLYVTNTSCHKQKTFLYEYPLHWVHKKRTTERCSSVLFPFVTYLLTLPCTIPVIVSRF